MRNIFSLLVTGSFSFFLACAGKSDHVTELPKDSVQEVTFTPDDCKRCIVITEQAQPAIVVVDVDQHNRVWEWNPYQAKDLQDPEWFAHPDEAKPVYNNQYALITASGGGVALIRMADKKVVFQAYAGGNPHSAEVLPDGNIVSASSTENYLTIFHVDTTATPGEGYKKNLYIPFGHNVVWDKKRQLLWSAGKDRLYAYRYNFNCLQPDLILEDSLQLPGDDAHDLFPVYGRDSLWMTNTTGVYYVDLKEQKVTLAETDYQEHIKSVSSGPEGFPVIISHPKEQWWTDEVIDIHGNSIFSEVGLKIYKARWWLPNPFSYPEDDPMKQCE